MFGTLRYNRESEHSEFINRTDSFLSNTGGERAACDKCRLAKLKCSGQRSGCDRCKARHTQCVYSASGVRASYKRRQAASASSSAREPKRKKLRGRKKDDDPPVAVAGSSQPLPTATQRGPSQPDNHRDESQLQEGNDKDQSPKLLEFPIDLELPPWPYDGVIMRAPDAELCTDNFNDMDAFDISMLGSPSDSLTSTLLSSPLLSPTWDSTQPSPSEISSPGTTTSIWYSSSEPNTVNAKRHIGSQTHLQALTTSDGLPYEQITFPASSSAALVESETDPTPRHASETRASISDALTSLEGQVANLGKTMEQEQDVPSRTIDNVVRRRQHQCGNQTILLIRLCEVLVNLSKQICDSGTGCCSSSNSLLR